jgi:lipoprotein-anchoring transpeptidase ErfK/SrfK
MKLLRLLRAATILVATTTGLACSLGAAQAQYYPSGPQPGVRLGPPMPVEEADDGPDIYAPPPPPMYPRRQLEAPYPGQAQPGTYDSRGQRQALPAPAPGTNFPAPADYPWTRERGNPAIANEPASQAPYDDRAPGQSGHIFNNGGLRPPGEMNTGPNSVPTAINPRSAVAALPPEEQPEEGFKELPPQFKRQMVAYQTREPAGTIIIDTPNTYLYLVLGNGQAMRYGIGVGREGFTWAGAERISRMSEWPDWHPPKEMIERQPYLPRFMAGGESNPLGARALYLGKTLYRIHGTNQPSTIGSFVSSGCIRLVNDDVADLYSRVQVGTRVVVLPGATQPTVGTAGSGPATAIR